MTPVNVINILDINCTHDKFMLTKCRSRRNLFPGRLVREDQKVPKRHFWPVLTSWPRDWSDSEILNPQVTCVSMPNVALLHQIWKKKMCTDSVQGFLSWPCTIEESLGQILNVVLDIYSGHTFFTLLLYIGRSVLKHLLFSVNSDHFFCELYFVIIYIFVWLEK